MTMSSLDLNSSYQTILPPKIKPPPQHLPPVDRSCTSDDLHPSLIAHGAAPRSFYLQKIRSGAGAEASSATLIPPPLISASPFVPRKLIAVLMRDKKDSALGVKYASGDKITNMEGALHTYVTPIIPRCEIIGDYQYKYGHGITPFNSVGKPHGASGVLLTRIVALSASIQPDFENPKVMLRVCKLDQTEVIGQDLLVDKTEWKLFSEYADQDDDTRDAYDSRLRAHMVFHLTSSHKLPGRLELHGDQLLAFETAGSLLDSLIESPQPVGEQLENKFARLSNNHIVSLELLYNSAKQQVINEFSALEALFPQGYVYTYDPPSIFARVIGSPILNRLFLAAIKEVSTFNTFTSMKIFAFNDYSDRKLVPLATSALKAQKHVRCMPKISLYNGPEGQYRGSGERTMLVIHNNSDAFGQNIETEWLSGSLDGAIGASSSAAASLERRRKDLLDFVF